MIFCASSDPGIGGENLPFLSSDSAMSKRAPARYATPTLTKGSGLASGVKTAFGQLTIMKDIRNSVPMTARNTYNSSFLAAASLLDFSASSAETSFPSAWAIAFGSCDGKMLSMNCSIFRKISLWEEQSDWNIPCRRQCRCQGSWDPWVYFFCGFSGRISEKSCRPTVGS